MNCFSLHCIRVNAPLRFTAVLSLSITVALAAADDAAAQVKTNSSSNTSNDTARSNMGFRSSTGF